MKKPQKRPTWLKKNPHIWICGPLTLPRRQCVLPFLIVSLNFVPEPETSRAAAAWGKLRGHKSIFSSFLSGCKRQHYHAEGFPCCRGSSPPAPRCMSSALPFGDETSPHFSHPLLLVGFFPWYAPSHALIWNIYIYMCMLPSLWSHAALPLNQRNTSRWDESLDNCAKKIEEYAKMRVND